MELGQRWTQKGLNQTVKQHFTSKESRDESDKREAELARQGHHDVGSAFNAILQNTEKNDEEVMAMQIDALEEVITPEMDREPLPR